MESRLSLVVSSSGIEATNKGILSTYEERVDNLTNIVLPDFRQEIEIKDGICWVNFDSWNQSKN